MSFEGSANRMDAHFNGTDFTELFIFIGLRVDAAVPDGDDPRDP